MATREGQAIRIALIIFAMIVVVLIVGCFYFSSQARDAEKRVTEAEDEKARSKETLQQKVKENEQLRGLLGYDINTKLEDITNNFRRDMLNFEEGADKVHNSYKNANYSLNYRHLPDYYKQKLIELKKQMAEREKTFVSDLASKDRENNTLQTSITTVTKQHGTIRDELIDTLGRTEKVIISQGDGLATTNAQLQKVTQDLNDKIRIERDKAIQFSNLLDSATRKITELERRIRELQPQHIVQAEADGKVVRISSARGMVTLDLGSQVGLKRQTTFSVYDADVSNVATATPKAKIEVTRVDPTSSEARILDEDIQDPILPGDKVYTVGWQPGQKLHFALVGKMDITGDGICDQKRIRNMIESVGSVVDGYVESDGASKGTVTNMTAYLVVGERPTARSGEEARQNFSLFTKEASDNNVKEIQVERFIQMMGWEMGEQTITSGSDTPSSKTPPGVTPRSTGSTSSAFRKRGPAGSGR